MQYSVLYNIYQLYFFFEILEISKLFIIVINLYYYLYLINYYNKNNIIII
jgi:hypothetical protein